MMLLLGAGAPAAAEFSLARALRATSQKLFNKKQIKRTSSTFRKRTSFIRGGITAHRSLSTMRPTLNITKSKILSDSVASQKKYGDSWTCRNSTCLLIDNMAKQGTRMKMDSSGKNAFRWGNEGLVSFHYYGVDSVSKPTVLLDPTATSNFARDVKPGGMLRTLLDQAGARLGHPKAAERVAGRIARGGVDGLLVLANQPEIKVYREALDQAAKQQVEMRRNAERSQ